jgi:hypothetical protein
MVLEGPGFLVYGGTRYKAELNRAKRYLSIFIELRKQRRAREINGVLVDRNEQIVRRLVNCDRCDDFHIIAIFRVSGCLLFCSNDKRADCYIKDKRLYETGQKPPSIYRKRTHRKLLNPKNMVAIRNLV